MTDIEPLLKRWRTAGVLDEETARRIRAYETEQAHPAGLHWQGMVAVTLGAILLACGVVLFVSAHWDQIGPGPRYALVMAMVAVFHLAAGFVRKTYHGLGIALHAVGTVSTGAAIALVGQIFNIQEHWPAAILLWAIAAAVGWLLLQDQAQQTLTLLLFPAWLLSEFMFHAQAHIGEQAYRGRFLVVWSLLYLTLFLDSKRRAAAWILFAAGAVGATAGIGYALQGWPAWSAEQTYLSLTTRLWGWGAIACLPLFFSIFRPRKSFIPVAAALAFSLALPWCMRTRTIDIDFGTIHRTQTYTEPNLAAHALVALFALFVCWWGVRLASRALVNLGIVGFAVAVGWFYFSDIFDKVGRSLGLISMGILFLAGGWLLEKARRRLLQTIDRKNTAPVEVENESAVHQEVQ